MLLLPIVLLLLTLSRPFPIFIDCHASEMRFIYSFTLMMMKERTISGTGCWPSSCRVDPEQKRKEKAREQMNNQLKMRL